MIIGEDVAKVRCGPRRSSIVRGRACVEIVHQQNIQSQIQHMLSYKIFSNMK
jgi:hypothetical protein